MSKIIAIVEAVIIIILILTLSNTVQSMATQISNLKTVNTELQDNVTELNKKLQGTLPYLEARGEQIQLTNQPNTHNPTWAELKAFLAKDDTDQLSYIEGSFTCGDFAKRLHDNAELAGIRAGVVAIEFQTGSPHACNVFYTTDKGIVYIDDTSGNFKWEKYDGVGYIEIGKGYGIISINDATSFSHSYYEDVAQKWATYQSDGWAYYKEESNHSLNISEMDMLQEWKTRLDSEGLGLPSEIVEPYGIVENFELYW
jgi:hypothetical protein